MVLVTTYQWSTAVDPHDPWPTSFDARWPWGHVESRETWDGLQFRWLGGPLVKVTPAFVCSVLKQGPRDILQIGPYRLRKIGEHGPPEYWYPYWVYAADAAAPLLVGHLWRMWQWMGAREARVRTAVVLWALKRELARYEINAPTRWTDVTVIQSLARCIHFAWKWVREAHP